MKVLNLCIPEAKKEVIKTIIKKNRRKYARGTQGRTERTPRGQMQNSESSYINTATSDYNPKLALFSY